MIRLKVFLKGFIDGLGFGPICRYLRKVNRK